MSNQNDPSQPAVLDVRPGFVFLAFLLYLCKPRISINGSEPARAAWGSNPYTVPAGRYQVEVWVPYLFFTHMGRNGIVVDVPAGSRVEVVWRAPWLAWLKGKIRVTGPVASAGGSAPAWGAPPTAGPPGSVLPPGVAPPPAQPVEPAVVAASQRHAPAGQVASGWYPDPTAHHQLRWYDGTTWTANVSDNGATSSDPLQP
jgi:hypothetical protein